MKRAPSRAEVSAAFARLRERMKDRRDMNRRTAAAPGTSNEAQIVALARAGAYQTAADDATMILDELLYPKPTKR